MMDIWTVRDRVSDATISLRCGAIATLKCIVDDGNNDKYNVYYFVKL